jgi:uncharacterized protein DUF4136
MSTCAESDPAFGANPWIREGRMRIIRTALHGAGLVLLAGTLAAQDVKTDLDTQYDFGTIKTYSIGIGTSWKNDLSERRVIASLDSVLQTRGWTRADDPSQADASVLVHGAVGQKVDLRTYYTTVPAYAGTRWAAPMVPVTEAYEYTAGTLVVDIFDVKSKNLVFRGSATDQLSDKVEKNQKKLVNAWKKMFKNFPPQPASK